MSNRARDIRHHYASGSAKRKLKEEKERGDQLVISKTRKLTEYFDVHGDGDGAITAEAGNIGTTSTSAAEGTIQQQPTSIECERTIEKNKYSNDIGEWPNNLDDGDREYRIAKGSDERQHAESNFSSSMQLYDHEKKPRHCQESYFTYVHKPTNKQHARNWLCYSESKGSLFCFPRKVMTSGCSSKFSEEGFNDWKNASNLLSRHEESSSHRHTLISLLKRKNKAKCVNSHLVKEMETEQKYWRTLLEQIIEVVKFSAEQGLSFHGSDETVGSPHNGNYLGLSELLAKFDPFLAEHINARANKGRGHKSYLSKTTCEEFISLIGSSILDHIISEANKYKYYSVSLDSTPDISNVDQLTLTVRYVLPSEPVERFVKFLDMEGHSAEQLAQSLLDFLKENDIDIKDCRGQSYDNASNLSGKYSGDVLVVFAQGLLQAALVEIPYNEWEALKGPTDLSTENGEAMGQQC
ncbi:zinc finger MYM-type protein 1-like [Mobula hypostoma]|uniref:zinc finger MYM-type protein 1-like n=1 Tax=Mobula hypostoma TaxID=723540 RepID=UPI002FC33077